MTDPMQWLRDERARQRDNLAAWEREGFRLFSQKPGEPERDITEETLADIRRIIAQISALLDSYKAG